MSDLEKKIIFFIDGEFSEWSSFVESLQSEVTIRVNPNLYENLSQDLLHLIDQFKGERSLIFLLPFKKIINDSAVWGWLHQTLGKIEKTLPVFFACYSYYEEHKEIMKHQHSSNPAKFYLRYPVDGLHLKELIHFELSSFADNATSNAQVKENIFKETSEIEHIDKDQQLFNKVMEIMPSDKNSSINNGFIEKKSESGSSILTSVDGDFEIEMTTPSIEQAESVELETEENKESLPIKKNLENKENTGHFSRSDLIRHEIEFSVAEENLNGETDKEVQDVENENANLYSSIDLETNEEENLTSPLEASQTQFINLSEAIEFDVSDFEQPEKYEEAEISQSEEVEEFSAPLAQEDHSFSIDSIELDEANDKTQEDLEQVEIKVPTEEDLEYPSIDSGPEQEQKQEISQHSIAFDTEGINFHENNNNSNSESNNDFEKKHNESDHILESFSLNGREQDQSFWKNLYQEEKRKNHQWMSEAIKWQDQAQEYKIERDSVKKMISEIEWQQKKYFEHQRMMKNQYEDLIQQLKKERDQLLTRQNEHKDLGSHDIEKWKIKYELSKRDFEKQLEHREQMIEEVQREFDALQGQYHGQLIKEKKMKEEIELMKQKWNQLKDSFSAPMKYFKEDLGE